MDTAVAKADAGNSIQEMLRNSGSLIWYNVHDGRRLLNLTGISIKSSHGECTKELWHLRVLSGLREEIVNLTCVSEACIWRLNEWWTGGGMNRSVKEDKGSGYNQYPWRWGAASRLKSYLGNSWQEQVTRDEGASKGMQRLWHLTGVNR